MEGAEPVSLELALDFRRLLPLNARLIRFAVECDLEDPPLSLLLDELLELEEPDECSISANRPG